ncbi:MAG: hypothetical protein D6724_06950 [Armatimonadetes bacterium]|nr:MAG: hypothetical protein D6724_06950 [Armatimonadota bacterium]
MSPKMLPKPAWWKNTYFLFGILLLIIAVLGFIRGAEYIRDPGQPFASALPWYYVVASLIFFVNGYLSHRAYVREYEAYLQEYGEAEQQEEYHAKVSHNGEGDS